MIKKLAFAFDAVAQNSTDGQKAYWVIWVLVSFLLATLKLLAQLALWITA